MLYADKRALENTLMVNLIEIRKNELDYYTRNCLSIATQAALFAGFAWAGIIQIAIPEACSDWLRAVYLAVDIGATCIHLIAMVIATICAMLGPGLALRGPPGAMHAAVEGMMVEYRQSFVLYASGIGTFFVSAILFTWTQWPWLVALPVSVVYALSLYAIYQNFRRIYGKFTLQPGEMIDGRVVSPYEAATANGTIPLRSPLPES